jgi:hypothetical protein
MCGSEPCKHQRADASDEIKSFVKAITELTAARATLAKVAAIVADPDAALVVDRVRAALEPTKGMKP